MPRKLGSKPVRSSSSCTDTLTRGEQVCHGGTLGPARAGTGKAVVRGGGPTSARRGRTGGWGRAHRRRHRRRRRRSHRRHRRRRRPPSRAADLLDGRVERRRRGRVRAAGHRGRRVAGARQAARRACTRAGTCSASSPSTPRRRGSPRSSARRVRCGGTGRWCCGCRCTRPARGAGSAGCSCPGSTTSRATAGCEFLSLSARGGTGVDRFYRGLGYAEFGRLPGAIRVGPGDDRDEILLTYRL